MIGENLTKISI